MRELLIKRIIAAKFKENAGVVWCNPCNGNNW